MENRTKVFFVQEIGKNEYETESLWCKHCGYNFIIDNIPFIAERISLGDTIEAQVDTDDGKYYFEDFISNSGNSTIRVYLHNDFKNELNDIRNWFIEKKCQTEVFLERNIIAINVPQNVFYKPIKEFLDNGENNHKWIYEESCLEHEY